MQHWVVPGHVPEELVIDFDIYNVPGGDRDPQIAWAALPSRHPVVWSPYNGGHWIASESNAVFAFYRDAKHFSSTVIGVPDPEGVDRLLPINSDAPDHTVYRKNIMPAFTADAVERLAVEARQLCVDLIEEARPRGECEFVFDIAFRYPLGLFMKMVGLPDEDRMRLRRIAEPISADPDPAVKARSFALLQAYIEEAINERIAEPRKDLITQVTRMKFGDRPYTLREMVSTVTLLCTAGLDTVAGVVAFIAWHLACHPAHADYIRSQLGNTASMHNIVQELLRRFAIVSIARVLAEDYTYQDIAMKKGDLMILPTPVYNLAAERIPDPDKVDFARRNTKHISFGSGPHTCAGALLAREEIRIFLEEWLTRISGCRLHPDHRPRLEALVLNQVHELWLQWDV